MADVFSQRTWHDDPKYLDREGVIYHYPRQYCGRINDFDRFIYYRPATGASGRERSTYIGHGVLGISIEDWAKANHYFVDIGWYEPFNHPVPLRHRGIFVETESATTPQFQSAARPIRETAYYRILMLGGVSAGREFAPIVTTDTVLAAEYSPLIVEAPRDALREALTIPEGTGYVPSGKALPSVYESAALQERARKDHNATLELVRRHAERLGGRCWFNNNIDLFVRCGAQALLVEAKSLNDARQSVDRMRYGWDSSSIIACATRLRSRALSRSWLSARLRIGPLAGLRRYSRRTESRSSLERARDSYRLTTAPLRFRYSRVKIDPLTTRYRERGCPSR